MVVKDPNSGKSQRVNDDNRALTAAVNRSEIQYVNSYTERKQAYTQSVSYTTAGAHTFYFLENDSSTLRLHVTGVRVQSTAADSFQVLIGTTGTPGGGAAVTPINCNKTTSNTADCTSYGDAEITGLTDGDEVDQIFSEAGGKSSYHSFPSDLILGQNQAISFKSAAAETWNVTVYFYFKEENEV